jgi:hypothetical protein
MKRWANLFYSRVGGRNFPFIIHYLIFVMSMKNNDGSFAFYAHLS